GGLPVNAVELPPFSCALVVRDLPLARLGLPGTLRFASADLVGAGPDGLELAARARSTVALDSDGGGAQLVEFDAPAPREPVRATVRSGDAEWNVVVRHPDDVNAPASTPAATGEAEVLTGAIRLHLETRSGQTSSHELPPVCEAVGVHRGRTHYAAPIAGTD